MLVKPTPEVPRRSWLAWAAFLVALYMAVGIGGWQRTLIPDEIRPLILAGRPLSEQMEYIRQDLIHPPLSFLLDRWWVLAFGDTDRAVKTLALVQNLATLVLFTALASRITERWRLASFLFVVPFLRVGSSVNLVRMYGPLLLWSVAALWLWESWREKPTLIRLAAWTTAVSLALYTHISGFALLAVFFVVNWIYGPRRWAFTVATALAALSFLPWVFYVAPVFLARGIEANVAAIRKAPTFALLQVPFYFLSGEEPGASSPESLLHTSGLREPLKVAAVLLHLALVFLAGRKLLSLGLPRRNDPEAKRWLWVCAILVVLPVVCLYAFSVLRTPIIHPRYLLVTLPAYWLLIVMLGILAGRPGRILLFALFLPWTLASVGSALVAQAKPSPARVGTLYIQSVWRDSDLILCERPMPMGYQVYWEWTRRLRHPGRFEVLTANGLAYAKEILPGKKLAEIQLAGVERVWFFWGPTRDPLRVSAYLQDQGFVKNDLPELQIPTFLLFTRSNSAGLSPAPAPSGTAPVRSMIRSKSLS